MRDECRKISESTIGDVDKLKWVTNWCQFLFQDQKMIPVSDYWKHSKSFNWRNIWTWREATPSDFLLLISSVWSLFKRLCRVVLCQIRFKSFNFIFCFSACVVLHLLLRVFFFRWLEIIQYLIRYICSL